MVHVAVAVAVASAKKTKKKILPHVQAESTTKTENDVTSTAGDVISVIAINVAMFLGIAFELHLL